MPSARRETGHRQRPSHGLRVVLLTALIAVATLSGCSAPSTTQPKKLTEAAVSPLEADVRSGDATLHLWIRGGSEHSKVVVLINGGPGLSHESMDPLQEKLASPSWRVVTYDQRGVGRSVVSNSRAFSPEDYVDDLEAIRRYLGQDQLHLLGHSFGGMVALSYLDRHPNHVGSIILVGTGVSEASVMSRGGERLAARVVELQHAGVIPDPIRRGSCRDRFIAILPAYFADPKRSIPEPMLRRRCDDSGRSAVLQAFIDKPYGTGLARATAPALVVYGAMDPFGSEPSRFAASILTHSKVELVELPGCGHLGWLECEDLFFAAVQPFLRGV